ncbi:uncharacterized protein LOC125195217 [Salvia hispanica]|uniref:uncharacterized protein LOC125195217 n=1 Tax=Salvia hispanica TaxID=49212 RepID=UPI002009B85E|nr:uncharacterized protein LOC125195217 [Salvia hispanica]
MGDRNYDGHANLGSSMIALSVRHQIENDPAYKVKAIVADIENRFHVKVSYKKAWYARRTAIELVYGGWEWSFKVQPSYLNEMQRQNPGTIVEWLHDDSLSRGMNKVFKYVFWAFGPAVEVFQLCKPVLTVDGTHLRGRCRGKILIAVGFDANKKCLPVAFAIADEETKESWNWFMERIRLHVAKYEICVISDRHVGITDAMNSPIWKEEPKGHHRFCLVHVRKNVLQNHKGIMVKRLVWKMGIATKKRKFKKRRRLLRNVNNEALQYLDTVDKEKWNLAYDNRKRWGEMTTNMVESYNNVLRGARELPIKACIDMTFWRTIEWFNQRSIASTQCATPLTPWAHEKVCKNDAKGQLHNVRAPSTL